MRMALKTYLSKSNVSLKNVRGSAVRLEVDGRTANPDDLDWLIETLEVDKQDVYFLNGPLDLTFIFGLVDHLSHKLNYLTYEKYSPQIPRSLGNNNLYELALKRDIFFHHHTNLSNRLLTLFAKAADDPNTIAIKQTLYRVSKDSPIIKSLKEGAEKGKQVTVLVELKSTLR